MTTAIHTENKSQPIRGYYRFSKAWYATDTDRREPSIGLGMYYPDGSTTGELSIKWQSVNNKLVPQLQAFDDSWKALSTFSDLFEKMAKWDDQNMNEKQFAALLNEFGFTDLTPYKRAINPDQRQRVMPIPQSRKMKR